MSSLPKTISQSSHVNNGWKQGHIGKDASFLYRPVNPSIIKKMPSETVTFVDIKLYELLLIRSQEASKRIKHFLSR